MRLSVFEPEFREDLVYWVEHERKVALRILRLVEAVLRDPLAGEGKPEPLKGLGAGVWSRRITQEQGLPPPSFVVADTALRAAATAEGFVVDDPLQHP